MKRIDPTGSTTPDMHHILLGAVAPRPIAFASTIDKEGNVNLSPFSFFNAFSSNPPIMIFSPNRRVRDNTTKHTLENVVEVPEVVINVVSYDMVQQMSLSSTEYGKGVNEFVKSGLSEVPSDRIRPPRIGEARVAFECKVNDIITLGEHGGAGNLVVCQAVMIHVDDEILDENGRIIPDKLDPVGRMGGNWYTRVSKHSLFEVKKPLSTRGIGVDAIPLNVRNSTILSGNDLGQLGNVEGLPSEKDVELYANEPEVSAILEHFPDQPDEQLIELHKLAKELIRRNEVMNAWKVLLQH